MAPMDRFRITQGRLQIGIRGYATQQVQSLTFAQRFGTPISTFLLYSSLTLISLQYLWTRLTFEETRLREDAGMQDLTEQVQRLRDEKLKMQAGQPGKGEGELPQGKNKRWWLW
ncbi:uncharacterized protein SPPG_04302 [Spizellomyces punctatus DAOM BR117]|uniref:Uncharacterized protein n=1 Tax=Spizellomyces punctatus (strain DAOM BR117) TaxID=645134 RepID=A0A0L0HJC8_SPIPD|nr:uncharacterized protein SPPG_04302 [Spizellomyces punctatus DAOM BR117]KND01212.1 hypothetical protein SPPG_04302 [Spizellomyces punctatus DAOM BR117]|eukprot:XP_016609251.1 hypothetical protein SPPG_04302 [Spizellomyces punctatus DAOM BR117]